VVDARGVQLPSKLQNGTARQADNQSIQIIKNFKTMKEFISIFTEAYRENPKQTNATAIEVVGLFILIAAVFIVSLYLLVP